MPTLKNGPLTWLMARVQAAAENARPEVTTMWSKK